MLPRNDLDLTWELTLLAVTALGLLVVLFVAIGFVQFVRWLGLVVVNWRRARSRREPQPAGLAADNGPRYARVLIILPALAFVGLAVGFAWFLVRDQGPPQHGADRLAIDLSRPP